MLQFETVAELNRTTLLLIILKLIQIDLNNEAVRGAAEHAGTLTYLLRLTKIKENAWE